MPEGVKTTKPPEDHAAHEQDVHDSLADLFISDPFASVEATTPSPGGRAPDQAEALRIEAAANRQTAVMTPVELVIPGHLPVRGSVWVRQYAAAIATATGAPAALVRPTDSTMIAERIEPSRCAEHDEPRSARSAEDVLRGCPTVLAVATEVDAFTHAGSDGVGMVTVLTAANDAAVVHAYQVLKTVAFRLDELGIDPAACRLGVAVIGEADERQAAAFNRIGRASATFLKREIVPRPGCTRCGPVRSSARVEVVAPATDLLNVARRRHDPVALEQPAPAAPRPGRHPGSQTEPARATPAEPDASALNGTCDPLPASATPAPTPTPRDTAPVPGRRRSRGALPAELAAVAFHCPDAPGVALGIDEHGRLHGIIRGRDVSPLLSARRWARRHAGLLALADPRLADWSSHPDLIGHAVYGEGESTGTLIVTGDQGHSIRELRPVVIADDDPGA